VNKWSYNSGKYQEITAMTPCSTWKLERCLKLKGKLVCKKKRARVIFGRSKSGKPMCISHCVTDDYLRNVFSKKDVDREQVRGVVNMKVNTYPLPRRRFHR
jgi:hypothetical protein